MPSCGLLLQKVLPFPLDNTRIELNKVDRVRTPEAKMNCFAETYKLVVDAIEAFSKKKESAGADDCTPVLVYLLLHSMPKQMMTTIQYLQRIR